MYFTPLSRKIDRRAFTCGNEEMDFYFREIVSQDVRNRLASCTLLMDEDGKTIIGFFTLSQDSIDRNLLPEDPQKGVYSRIPITLLGRIAVDCRFQKTGRSDDLIAKALEIIENSRIGSIGLLAEPKAHMESFYQRMSFEPILNAMGEQVFIKFLKKTRVPSEQRREKIE